MSPVCDRKKGVIMRTAYPAVIHPDEGRYWVEFPDLPGCFSDGDTLSDAAYNAEEALGLYLCSLMDTNESLPNPSDITAISPEDGFTSLVVSDPLLYKKSTRAVKKTLTIPEWLNIEAEKRHINFSSVLQQALLAIIQ